MPKKKPSDYPSRKNAKYVMLPLELWKQLKGVADAQDRSVSYMARKAVKEFLAKAN